MIISKGETLPEYADNSGELPFSYPVGSLSIKSFVTLSELRAYLRLLGAFAKLKESVLAQASVEPTSDNNRAWVVYVNRAVHRFNVFMGSNWSIEFPGWMEKNTPPIDVLMVLHAYMLNPRAFYEDTVRRTTYFARNLAAIGYLPVRLAASLIDPVTLKPLPPTPERMEYFNSIVNESFDLPLQSRSTDRVGSLNCPRCDILVHRVPWLTDDGKGFSQPFFAFICPGCNSEFTKPMMGVRRFADEMTRSRANRRVYFAETLLNPRTGKADDSVADMFMTRLLRRLIKVYSLKSPCEQDKIAEEGRQLAAGLQWNLDDLAEHLQAGLRPTLKFDANNQLQRVQRIIAAYSNPGPASVDLIGAVLRLSVFADQVHELGWTKAMRFEEGEKSHNLVRAIARYHAFLDLISQSNDFFVPTLDIDLVWHTHQLSGQKYREDTVQSLDRTPDHPDTVEQAVLQSGYDDTAKAWKARFGVPYSLCGCIPDPGPEVIKQKSKVGITKLFKFGPKYSNSGITGPNKVERAATDYPDLITIESSDADFYHPSDHNLHRKESVNSSIQPEAIGRELDAKNRASKIIANTKGEEVDQWRMIQADRKQNGRTSHREAFTGPDDAARFPDWARGPTIPQGFFAAGYYDNTTDPDGPYAEMGLGRDSNWMPSVPYA